MSCGEDVSGDEIVFVLEQVDKREAGTTVPVCDLGQDDPGVSGVALRCGTATA
jgi:hypothetical protein